MSLEPWYKVAQPRKEVREGRSFNPDEFAIALEQVVAGKAPEDYRDPEKFFLRTCFTRALKEHAGMVLRRLAGKTENSAPVLTLITQFGGGKTHTLAALYHLVRQAKKVAKLEEVANLVKEARLSEIPSAKVAVFVGNAWDPQAGRETPWIDVARQLAGDAGVAALGPAAKTTPPGTETIGRVIEAADGSALILFDEVLNFLNRHRGLGEGFYAFIQNLSVAVTGIPKAAVDSATTDAKSRDFLRARFEACYPFHPATLSVFQRKWQTLPQYQQTRGTLAMLAQWISWAYRDGYQRARREPLITLGSAPLEVPEFRAVILGQLGESRLLHAIEADLTNDHSHARALDADTKGTLRDVHRRVGTAILFESSGGQGEKAAHLPELRFALGEPEVETTSIDNAAVGLEVKGYYIRKAGRDGFRFGFKPTLKKVVNDRRASLDDGEVKKATQALVRTEFVRDAALPLVLFPEDGSAVQDTPKLTLVILDAEAEWEDKGPLKTSLADWTKQRGKSPRLYPGSLVWWVRKPGREL